MASTADGFILTTVLVSSQKKLLQTPVQADPQVQGHGLNATYKQKLQNNEK